MRACVFIARLHRCARRVQANTPFVTLTKRIDGFSILRYAFVTVTKYPVFLPV
jgi:hypothetical protein